MAARASVPQPRLSRCWFDTALPMVESRRACDSRAAYQSHTHPTLSVGAVDAGNSVFSHDSLTSALRPGAVVWVPANCVHACNPAPDSRWSYQMIHIDAQWADAVLDEAGRGRVRRIHVKHDPTAYRIVCALNAMLFSEADPAEKEAALIAFVGDMQQLLGEGAEAAHSASANLTSVTAILRARHDDRLPLADLAAAAGVSRYQLIRQFRAQFGMTPHAFQLDLRINQARRLLRRGDAPADVAQRLGFVDQSHFHRAFQQRVAMTPGAYQRAR
ncbi:AraC family transcriptional regulator [Cupriavidus pauculus]|uniref:AraC family transcriptional regulator n=1 Tax=Cupriavidus pauculus TaxID=82633 RepID=UPI001245CC25|nr:AraC family transcriptional regulator [Cupriavidus pauculus]KAB0604140.1 AraC family transcriptional regulator [Cupriavidus pauculus]MCM3606746.1 AraC family transcriptional regulator [Cupriavidus pauculus]UAL00815.1 AraC family transcriptional regulator [Cupriavidus pauculus]